MFKFAALVLLLTCTIACATSPTTPTTIVPSPSPIPTNAFTPIPSLTFTPTLTPIPTATPTATATLTPTPTRTPSPTPTPRIARSIDLVTFQSNRNGAWFNASIDTLPATQNKSTATFEIKNLAIQNRRNGKIAPTLIGGYIFLQFGEVTPDLLDQHLHTIGALFIRSALLSFVDYPNNRVLGWDRTSVNIPANVREIIALCNRKNIPVFLQINYSDYVPGALGTGVDSLQRADNLAGTIVYLKALKAQGLHVAGVTFGDEIDDEAGFGNRKPTLSNSDLISRFIAYARAIKNEFPELKVYAFDSYIAATRGQVPSYFDYFQSIRQQEIKDGKNLLDGFTFRESYTYINDKNQVMDSQRILDDTESLYRDTPVYRYDVMGITRRNPTRDYLHLLINKTREIFGRNIDIGLTEYLPAGPVQIDESDTSRYADIDFILHYSDVVGIYAELGLDTVSSWLFANINDQAKCYIEWQGNRGANYPIHEQLARYFAGEILSVDRSVAYEQLKVKVYAARNDKQYFVMILNKDVANEATVRIMLPGQFDLTVRLPRRSYTSLIVDEKQIKVAGIGNN